MYETEQSTGSRSQQGSAESIQALQPTEYSYYNGYNTVSAERLLYQIREDGAAVDTPPH